MLETTLTTKQEDAILALLSEPSIVRAAESVGVTERTLHRWLTEEAFADAYRTARRETFGQAIGLCQRYATLSVTTLAKIMADTSAPTAARVSAATAVLKFARDGIELDDLAARVDALETTWDQDPALRAHVA